MGTLLLILIIVLLVAAVAGGGRHVYRSYGPYGGGAVAGPSSGTHVVTILLALAVIFLLLALYAGFNVFDWFGQHVSVH